MLISRQMDKEAVVHIYHVFLLCSSVSGHLCRLHLLGIVGSAAMNIGMCVFLNYIFLKFYAQEWDSWIRW